MEWTEEKALSLIEVYQNTPVLWDPKNKDYYKKHLKVDAWETIGQAIGTSGEYCKNKMITLLACYRREKMKIKKSTGTGKGTSEINNSKWFAFDAMSFLLNRDTPRKNTLNTVSNTTEREDSEHAAGAEGTSEPPNCPAQSGPPSKKEKRDPKLQMLKEAFGILKSASSNTNTQNEEIKSFLTFVGSKMMKYSEHTKNMVQQGICDLIFKADCHYFDEYPYQHTCNRTQTSQGYSSVQSTSLQAYSQPANVGYYTGPSTSKNMEQVSQIYASVGPPSPGQPSPGQSSPGQPSPGQPSPGQPSPGQPSPSQPSPGQPSPGQPSPQHLSTNEQYAMSSPHSELSELLDMDDYV